MNECQRADYLILLRGGCLRMMKNITKQEAICIAHQQAKLQEHTVTLVEVLGEVRLEAARWVDAKDSK